MARTEIAEARLGDRVNVASGDYWTDDLGDGYDLALAFNVVHAHDAGENLRLFERIGAAVEPGGRIAILDQLAESARTPLGEVGIGFVGLTYLTTLGARLHAYEDVAGWLQAAGFEDVRRSSIRPGWTGEYVRPGDEIRPLSPARSFARGREQARYAASSGGWERLTDR